MDMDKVLRNVAREHGVTVKEVREEMQKAITEAWKNPPEDGGMTAARQRRGNPHAGGTDPLSGRGTQGTGRHSPAGMPGPAPITKTGSPCTAGSRIWAFPL